MREGCLSIIHSGVNVPGSRGGGSSTTHVGGAGVIITKPAPAVIVAAIALIWSARGHGCGSHGFWGVVEGGRCVHAGTGGCENLIRMGSGGHFSEGIVLGVAVPDISTLRNVLEVAVPDMGTLCDILGVPVPNVDTLCDVLGVPVPDTGTLRDVLGVPVPDVGTLHDILGVGVPDIGTLRNVLGIGVPDIGTLRDVQGVAITVVICLLLVDVAILLLAAVIVTGTGAGAGGTCLTACLVISFTLCIPLDVAGSWGCGSRYVSMANAGVSRDRRKGGGGVRDILGTLRGGNTDAARLK